MNEKIVNKRIFGKWARPISSREKCDLNTIYIPVDDGDNHDKGNDNGSPTDTKMTGQKDLKE